MVVEEEGEGESCRNARSRTFIRSRLRRHERYSRIGFMRLAGTCRAAISGRFAHPASVRRFDSNRDVGCSADLVHRYRHARASKTPE